MDESRLVVARGGTERESAAWISYDDCQTWEQLPVVGGLVGVRATAERVLGFVLRNQELHSFVFDLNTRASRQTRLEHKHTRVAIDEKGFVGFGQGITRYSLDAGTTAGITFPGLQIVAACDPAPMVAVEQVGNTLEFSAYGADGARWWTTSTAVSSSLESGSICADGRLFLTMAGVVVEVHREGLRPLRGDSISSKTEHALLSAEGINYFTADDSTTAVARMSWGGQHWSWDGAGTLSDPSSLDGIALGEFTLEIRYQLLDSSEGVVGYAVKTPGQDQRLAEIPLKFDTGLRRMPPFRQINTPRAGMVFHRSTCYFVTVDQTGSRLGGWPCDPSGSLEFYADVVADPEVEGRWLVYPLEGIDGWRNSLLVEDFGERVTSLGRPGVFVFDQRGQPLQLPDAHRAVSLAGRRGYWAETSSGMELHLFDGRSFNWPDSRLLGAAGDSVLLRGPHSLLTVTTTH